MKQAESPGISALGGGLGRKLRATQRAAQFAREPMEAAAAPAPACNCWSLRRNRKFIKQPYIIGDKLSRYVVPSLSKNIVATRPRSVISKKSSVEIHSQNPLRAKPYFVVEDCGHRRGRGIGIGSLSPALSSGCPPGLLRIPSRTNVRGTQEKEKRGVGQKAKRQRP